MKSTDETSMNFFRLNNISCTLLDLVEGSLKEVGLEAVTKHEYPVPDTEVRIAASREFRYETTAAMAPLLLRTGQAKTAEEAEAIVEKDLNNLQEVLRGEVVFDDAHDDGGWAKGVDVV
jgi:hypothetical protein